PRRQRTVGPDADRRAEAGAEVPGCLCPGRHRPRGRRRPHLRDHRGDALGHVARQVRHGLPRSLLRCRYRRAARRDVRGRPGDGGPAAVVGIYSSFLQRAYDQIIHDVAIQRLPVIFGLDRAGFAGDDGRTHHGVFDLSYLRAIPNMVIMAPKDEMELRHIMKTAVDYTDGPIAMRYPRGAG